MTRHPNDRLIDSYVYIDQIDQRIYAGVYVAGKYHYLSGYWFYSDTARAIHDYLINPDGTSDAMSNVVSP